MIKKESIYYYYKLNLILANISLLLYKFCYDNISGFYDIATIYISPYQAKNSKKAPRGLKQVSTLL